MVLVRGESGIGKTALVRSFTDGLTGDGSVLWGSCDPLETPRPVGPLHDVAVDLGGRVPQLLAEGAYSHEIFAAVFEALRRGPCVFVVDDVHWADEGTLDLLRFLLRRVSSTPCLVIGTYRDDEVGATHPLRPLLGDVARSPDAVCVPLRPLSRDAIVAMIGSRAVDAGEIEAITGGNAFFVSEVLSGDDGEVPSTVRDAVLARTVGLDPDVRDFLDLLACAPAAIPDRALPALGVGLRPLRALAETGLIERGRRGIAFRHELCRLAVASAIPPGGEVALHLRMLDSLEAMGAADPAVLANHATAAGDAGRILRYASLAGVAAARSGAHTQAASFFETALRDGGSQAPAEQAELLERQAVELYLTNRLAQAIESCEQAMALRRTAQDPSGVSRNHHALAVFEWYNANRAVAEQHASAAVEVLEPVVDLVRLGHAYSMVAYLAMQGSDLTRVRRYQARAWEVAAEAADRPLDARLEIIDAVAAIMAGDLAGRDQILAVVGRDPDWYDGLYSSGLRQTLIPTAYGDLVYLDVEQRRFRDAAEVLEVSLPLTIERGIPIHHSWQLGTRGRLRLLEGDWDAAITDVDEVLGGPAVPVARTWPHLVRGLVALRRGGDGAVDDLDAAWALATRLDEPLRLLPAAAALAEQAWLRGRHDERLDRWPDLFDRFAAAEGIEWSIGDLAVWLHRLGHEVVLGDVSVAAPHRLFLAGEPGLAAIAWDELAVPYDRALALLDTGAPDDAFAALDILDRLGADAVAAKARQDLRDRGVANVPARKRAPTRSNPAGLTARQVDVLRLLGEGLTNNELATRLFISPKTADHHVSAILTKLQVRNRREAAAEARRLGLLG
jgi:DNA-binding CsgD family transcriptional regulator